jgi:hypothetical protein
MKFFVFEVKFRWRVEVFFGVENYVVNMHFLLVGQV